MKKLVLISLLLVVVVLLSGCGEEAPPRTQASDSTNGSKDDSTNVPVSPILELDIRIQKDVYLVGESLEGSEYFLKYEGESFKGLVLYSESTLGFAKKSYSETRGTIKTGSFDVPRTLPGLKVSMYSVDGEGNPNPFECDGIYEYSISVYDCEVVDKEFGTDDCGKGGWPPTIESKEIFARVSPLKTKSKTVSVVCPDGSTDCCTNLVYRCSYDRDCMEGFECMEGNCFLE